MIETLNKENLAACAEMAHLLWPEAPASVYAEDLAEIINSDQWKILLYKSENNDYTGFIQLSLRNDYVEGSTTSPVVYIEGIYIAEAYRRKGIAKELVKAGEAWGKEKGCSEIASDCLPENTESYNFHTAAGFEEASRIICFIKKIG